MTLRGGPGRWKKGVGRILRLLARPVRTAQGKGGLVVQPYRGYGSRERVFLIGRVFRQSPRPAVTAPNDLTAHLRDIARRIVRRAVPGALVTARLAGAERQVRTDKDGYFRVEMAPGTPLGAEGGWHPMGLVLEDDPPVQAEGQVLVPPAHCRFVVVSDIDDTVMYTGVASKIGMLWRLFVEDAEGRVPFPGVAALYRALHDGTTGDQGNPVLYVSRAPWGIYDILDAFFRMQRIPVGPVMFLREWGISWKRPLPRRAKDHKQLLISKMLDLYHDLPFVLVGDSGQHDPEIYRQIVEDNPGRVLTVLIRNVSRSPARAREVEALARAVSAAGSSLLLAADSAAMARHAAELGLIPPAALAEVEAEMRDKAVAPGDTVRAAHPGEAGDAAAGGLAGLLTGRRQPKAPNVVVEPVARRPRRLRRPPPAGG